MTSKEETPNADEGRRLSEGLGLAPERAAFEAWKRTRGGHYMSRNNTPGTDLSGYQDAQTQAQWDAWRAAVAAERERCASEVPSNWCDPLLTGPRSLVRATDDRQMVERLLMAVRDRIRGA